MFSCAVTAATRVAASISSATATAATAGIGVKRARKRENQRAKLGKREKRAAEKTLSVASAHGKAITAKKSREAIENTNMIHDAGDGRGVGRPCGGRLRDEE